MFHMQSIILLGSAFLLWLIVEPDLFGLADWLPALPFFAFVMVVGLLFLLTWRLHPERGIFSLKRLTRKNIRAFALSYLAIFALLVPLGLISGFLTFSPNFIPFYQVFLIFFLNALPEELLFRAVIQDFLQRHLGAWPALLLTAMIFGLAHLNNFSDFHSPLNWHYGVFATIAGLGYGLLYQRSRSLWLVTLLHCSINTTWQIFFRN